MGLAKRQMEEDEGKRQLAISIATEVGVLTTCEFHEEIILRGDEDIEKAYRLGNTMFSSGKIKDAFSSRSEMTDCIKQVVEENPSHECSYCDKWNKDD